MDYGDIKLGDLRAARIQREQAPPEIFGMGENYTDRGIMVTFTVIENFNTYVTKKYSYISRIESIDDKILDFLLTKTFLGIPLLVIELFDYLMKSQKFMKISNNEFKITQELIDDNDTFDWSNILLPYVYEKITSMTINSLLSFKELLISQMSA